MFELAKQVLLGKKKPKKRGKKPRKMYFNDYIDCILEKYKARHKHTKISQQTVKEELGEHLVKLLMPETSDYNLLKIASKLLKKYKIPVSDVVMFLKPHFSYCEGLVAYIVKLVHSPKPERFFHNYMQNVTRKYNTRIKKAQRPGGEKIKLRKSAYFK